MALQPGNLLNNRYRIDAILAEGGMGAVYRAFDEVLNITVAVKENFFTSKEGVRQFRHEATILADMRHPNLPRVTDHFSLEGSQKDASQYLVMDFIEGEDLLQIMKHGDILPEAEVARIGILVCDALSYLHTRKPAVIHRDIKPGNIKITPGGGVFLVDFGLAKIAKAGQETTTGARALTPGYAPPEQYGQGTDPRSDIYSLGATLYVALTGKVPEDGLHRAMNTIELTPLRENNPAISASLARVIEHALEVLPEARYQTAADFRKALAAVFPPAPPAAQPAPIPATQPVLPKPVLVIPLPMDVLQPDRETAVPARSWIWAGLGGLFVIAIVVALAFFSRAGSGFTRRVTPTAAVSSRVPTILATRPVIAPVASATSVPAVPTLTLSAAPSSAPTATLAASPVSTPIGGAPGQIAYASSQKGLSQIWLIHSDGTQPTQITNLPDGACQPDWSPDGAQLVFVSPCRGKQDTYPGSSLYLISAAGSGLIPLPALPGGDYDPAWSPDGKQIAFTSLRDGRSNIYLYTLADGATTRLSSPVNYERRPAWSPDGKEIAYETNRSGASQIWIMSSDGKNTRQFSGSERGTASMAAWAPDGSVLIYAQGGSPTFLNAKQVNKKLAIASHLTDALYNIQNANFSPDGWWITFSNQKDKNEVIYIMLRNGGSITRLSSSASTDFQPAWRP